MAGCTGDEGEVVDAGAMRHRRGVDDGVVGMDLVDVDEIARGHRIQVAMRLHHALGPAGGARGVEQPGQVVGCTVRGRHGRCGQRRLVGRFARRVDLAQRGQAAEQRLQIGGKILGHEQDRRTGIAEDELDLARVQLGVDRHHRQPGPPGGIQQLQVRHVVGHVDRHTIAGLQPETIAQVACQPRRALGQFAVAQQRLVSQQHRGPVGVDPCGSDQELREIHRARSRMLT